MVDVFSLKMGLSLRSYSGSFTLDARKLCGLLARPVQWMGFVLIHASEWIRSSIRLEFKQVLSRLGGRAFQGVRCMEKWAILMYVTDENKSEHAMRYLSRRLFQRGFPIGKFCLDACISSN